MQYNEEGDEMVEPRMIFVVRWKGTPKLRTLYELNTRNKETLERILKELFRLVREKDTRVVVLSGDIHIGGVTEIVERIEDKVCTIPQIVSSAISNKPMPKVVEGLTSTTSEMKLDSENELFARNIFYKSKRNFVQIFPKHLLEKSDHAAVSFHFEDHRLPISFDPKYVD